MWVWVYGRVYGSEVALLGVVGYFLRLLAVGEVILYYFYGVYVYRV